MAKFNLEKEKYINYAKQMAQKYNLPEHLFLGQLEQESNWNPKAQSSAGAKGIGQFMPKWHPLGSWKFKKKEDYFDPYKSIESAAMYMQSLNKQYDGNYMAALAHYNGGYKQGQLVASGQTPAYSETANYIPLIQQKAQKYQPKKGIMEQTVNQVSDTVENVTNQLGQAINPSLQTNVNQQIIKDFTDLFTKYNQTSDESNIMSAQTPKSQSSSNINIPRLDTLIPQENLQTIQTQQEDLRRQEVLNQQAQENTRRQNLQNLGALLSNFSRHPQSYRVPDLSYTPSQNPMPQPQVSQYNPWKTIQRSKL